MFDREAILAAVDLPALADELLGDRSGTPRTSTWRCLDQQHARTGRTPPVTVFAARDGLPRWHCHGCRNGGTAIDLVMQVSGINVRDAMAELASRYGMPALPDRSRHPHSRGSDGPMRSKPGYVAPVPVAEIEPYVVGSRPAYHSLVGHSPLVTAEWAGSWQRSWDRLEEELVPDRENKIRMLLDIVEAVAGPAPTVVDLACGPGTITCRLLDRLPEARSIAVDVDPVLLTIASATFADDDRVQVVEADLRNTRWREALAEPQVDGVLTATALHWLPEEIVRRIYCDLAAVVRHGGVVAHSEYMPLLDLPRVGPALAAIAQQRRSRSDDGRIRWDAWWAGVSRDPALRTAMTQRRAVFETTYPTEEFSPPADWHMAALRNAGFSEVGVVWRSGAAAIVAAVR